MKVFCSLSGNSGELDLFYVSLLSEIELHFIFANFPQISHLKAVVSKEKRQAYRPIKAKWVTVVVCGVCVCVFRCLPHLPPPTGLFLVCGGKKKIIPL